jgi:branched-chain amino acid transport system substrate-binding protein
MKKAATAFAFVALAAAAVAAAGIAKPTATGPVAVDAVNCRGASIGFAGPLTGPAAFLGQEQLSWSKFAASQYNRQFKTTFKIVQGDTQLSAALARTVGRQFVSNKSILGVIGPSTSQAVISSAGLFKTAALAAVSGSATRTDLTTGGKFPTFFRVVPNDFVQAPSIVSFSIGTLKAKHVVIVDSQDDYSTALAK